MRAVDANFVVTEDVCVCVSKPCEVNVRLFADQAELVCARVRFQHGQRTPGFELKLRVCVSTACVVTSNLVAK